MAALGFAVAACGGGGHVVTTGSAPATGSQAAAAGPSASTTSTSGPLRPLALGKVIYTANFADPAQAWPTGTDANQSLSVSGGDYLVTLKGPGQAIPLPSYGPITPADLVNVGVSATVQINTASPGDGVGVACRDIHSHAYVFMVGPSDTAGQLAWSIARQDTSASPQDTTANRRLASGTVAQPGPGPLNLEGDCVGGGKDGSPVTLVLSLGSQPLGQANDTSVAPPYFGAASVLVSSAKAATAATFSTFQIRAATAS